MELGQWQRAELLLQQAVDASPDDPEARRQLAEALWHRGAITQAVSHMEAALQANPNDPSLAVRAGEMSLAMGRRDEALHYANQAIRRDPRLAKAWALRGRVYWQSSQPERAIADLSRALEFAPDNTEVLLDLAVIYRELNRPTRCLTTISHLHDRVPVDEHPQAAYILEGLALLDLGRPQQSAESFVAATQRGPANAQLFFYLAQARYGSGDYSAATAAAQQALALDGSHAPSRQLLAQIASHATPSEPQRR